MSNKAIRTVRTDMIRRCHNPNFKHFKYYGGRGIKVCKDWHTLEPFLKWALNNGYRKGLQIDRVNNDGNYEPSNCRFVDRTTNLRNTRAIKTKVRRRISKNGFL